MTTQRPAGVTILAVLQLIGGIANLLFGITSLFFGGAIVVSGAAASTGSPAVIGPMMTLFGALFIAIGVFGLVLSYGLLNLQQWAWKLAMALAAINVVTHLISLFQGSNVPGAIVSMVISGLILYYLFRPNVKRGFGLA